MIIQAWRTRGPYSSSTEYGIIIGEVELEEMELTKKSIRIDLDGEIHTFRIGNQYGTGNGIVVRGEPFRDWFVKRGVLEWGHTDRPQFDLVEIMVPQNERRLWRLVG